MAGYNGKYYTLHYFYKTKTVHFIKKVMDKIKKDQEERPMYTPS